MTPLALAIKHLSSQNGAISDFLMHEGAPLRYRDAIGDVTEYPDCTVDASELADLLSPSDEKLLEHSTRLDKVLAELTQSDGDEDRPIQIDELRFRANAFFHGGNRMLGAVLRRVPDHVPTFTELGLDESFKQWLENRAGLILVTGPAGSGKTSTLAAFVDYLNSVRAGHIITIEDPIEYVHKHRRSIVTQREVGQDSGSFPKALRAALRQNPNAIVVGEIRDRETMETALFAAETGHLVLATLHSTSASRVPERVVDNFPDVVKGLARSQLASTLIGVVAQMLVPRMDLAGKLLVTEAMTNTKEVAAFIKDNKFGQLQNAMSNGGEVPNLWLLNKRLADMVSSGVIKLEDALNAAYDRQDLKERTDNMISTGQAIYSGDRN